MIYTEKMRKAIKFAIKTHDVYQKQTRKGKGTAYITHPLTVGFILACADAPEDVIVAGILHDTIEDSIEEKKVTHGMIEERFGKHVADIVQSVTETGKSRSWKERKEEALRHIENYPPESFLVKSADLISNVSELVDDHARYEDEVFIRFNAPKEKILENYGKVIRTIIEKWKENPLRDDLIRVGKRLDKIR